MALATFAVVEAASYGSIQALNRTVLQLTYTSRVLTELDDVLSEVTDAETAKRGYLLTGEERYLGHYHDAVRAIAGELAGLRTLMEQEEPRQRQRLAEFEVVIAAKFAEVGDMIELRRTAGFGAATQAFRAGRGKELMDRIRLLHHEMAREEMPVLEARQAEAQARVGTTFTVMGLGSVLGLVVVGIAIVHIQRDVRRREQGHRASEAARADLAVRVSQRTAELEQANGELRAQIAERERAQHSLGETLARLEKSGEDMECVLNGLEIGTAVVDAAGRLVFLSQSAERLVGRSLAALRGQSWQEAFPLGRVERDLLEAMCASSRATRTRVPVHVAGPHGRQYRLSIDVQDDPRDPQSKIFLLYDVTEVYALRHQLGDRTRFGELIGKSAPVASVYRMIEELAKVDATVLVEGETGTGKELVARAIHAASRRKHKAFVAVNSAGLTDSLLASQLFGHRRGAFTGAVTDQQGLFEAAEGGSLFLDEIGDMPPSVQIALLRALQEREITRVGESKPRRIDVRVLAATQHDLTEEVAAGRFRADLLYRLRVARITLPPLRERREDIPLLVEAFLAQCRSATGKGVHDVRHDAMRLLLEHAWPGNVRELKSAIEFAVICATGAVIRPEDLPPEIFGTPGASTVLADDPQRQREHITRALLDANGNRSKAARLLRVSRATLYRRLSELGISAP